MRAIRALMIAAISAVVASVVAYVAFLRPKIRVWGFDEREARLPLAGDDLVADPTAVETRGITINAPPSSVWPWLVQMGYGRGGWYSYEPLDSKLPSAHEILPEFQELNVGDKMPTYPGFAFEVKVVEPATALVLFADTAMARPQMEVMSTKAADDDDDSTSKAMAKASRSVPDFAFSWAFYLQPEGTDQTRVIERFRIKAPKNSVNAITTEIMGTGIVLMARKQLLGIKERVEKTEPTREVVLAPA